MKGTSPDHFSPTRREEEVGWPHETTLNFPVRRPSSEEEGAWQGIINNSITLMFLLEAWQLAVSAE